MNILLRCHRTEKAIDANDNVLKEYFTKDKIYKGEFNPKANAIIAYSNTGKKCLICISPEFNSNINYFKKHFTIKSPYYIRSIFSYRWREKKRIK